MICKSYKLYPLTFLLSLAGCSSRTMQQFGEGMTLLFAVVFGFFLLFWFGVTVHKSLGKTGQKTWEKICGIGIILLLIAFAFLGDGGGDMEHIWRPRR